MSSTLYIDEKVGQDPNKADVCPSVSIFTEAEPFVECLIGTLSTVVGCESLIDAEGCYFMPTTSCERRP